MLPLTICQGSKHTHHTWQTKSNVTSLARSRRWTGLLTDQPDTCLSLFWKTVAFCGAGDGAFSRFKNSKTYDRSMRVARYDRDSFWVADLGSGIFTHQAWHNSGSCKSWIEGFLLFDVVSWFMQGPSCWSCHLHKNYLVLCLFEKFVRVAGSSGSGVGFSLLF